MGCLIAILGVLYIVSPIDFWPGVIDDVVCAIIMAIAYYHHRKAVRREEAEEEERRAQQEQERRERKERLELEKREAKMREEREKREAEIRELELIEKMTARNSNTVSTDSAFCGHCGSAVKPNANYCSRCGTKIERVQGWHAEVPQFCESCGGPLEPSTDDLSVITCAHCGRKHILPGYAAIQIEKMRQETQKESDNHREQMLETFLDNRGRQKTLQMLVSRAGTIIGVVFCILALTINRFATLWLIGVPLLIYDVVKSKSRKTK